MSTTNGLSGASSPSTSTTPTPSPSPCIQQGGASSLERARYFARQLLTADDLTADQQHVLAKLRRHNRYLHGWGVVCGAGVRAVTTQDWTVVVEPGYLLGPQGDEILIDRCVQVDLSRQGLDGNATSPCVTPVDPWCASTRVDLRIGQQLFIAAAYAECLARPVRVQPAGCGCDDAGCEYSRLRDGFVIRALSSLPDSYAQWPAPVRPYSCPPGGVRPCPACIDDPWVLLASVTIRGSTISDNDIDNVSYRRHVISFGDDFLLCGPKLLSLTVDPGAVVAGDPSTGTVTLDRPAPQGDSFIQLKSSDPTSATAPDNVMVPATHTSNTFPIKTSIAGPGGTVTISGTLMGDEKTAPLSILTLSKLEIDPPSAEVGDKNVRGKVTISAPAPTALSVRLSVDNPSIAVPSSSSVTIPANGTSSPPFAVPVLGSGLATFTAALDGVQRTATLSVYSLTSLTAPKAIAGQQAQGTVQLTGEVPAGGVTVNLQSANLTPILPGNALVASVPASVAVPAGTNPSATFTIEANRGGTASLTATLGTQKASATIDVVGLKQFLFTDPETGRPTTDGGLGKTVNGDLTLSEAVPAGMRATVSLASTSSVFQLPPTVTIDAGSSTARFTVKGEGVRGGSPPIPINARLGGDTLTQDLTPSVILT